MLKCIIKNKEIINIYSLEIIDNKYRNKEFKTLLINNEIKLNQRDKIIFICDMCGKEVEEKFAFNKKFFTNMQDCRECDISNTKQKKYGSSNAISQIKKAVKERYGVENISQLKEIKEKVKQTMLNNYGVENNFLRPDVRKKIYKDGIYGNNRDKAIKTVKERYGVNNVSRSDEVKNKKKETCFKNYGVEHPTQNTKLFRQIQSSYGRAVSLKTICDTLHYQTKPELQFIQYCKDNNINICDGPSLLYQWNSKNHVYHVDFETDKYIIEIKESHGWYREDLESGKIDAKNKAAQEYAISIGKEFLFLLNVKDYSGVLQWKNQKI